jgi:hypothetical protein
MKDEKKKSADNQEEKDLPGYPSYPKDEDIYKQFKEEDEIDPDDLVSGKEPNVKPNERNAKDFNEDVSGGDLDVPGSELDDDMEERGDEDEENNYYSLGSDNHNDLEEDKGD